MVRKARIKNNFGFFYIRQISSNGHALFQSDADRSYFLKILKRVQKKFDFKLYAYCILSPDAYHLVINTNGSDLSSIMKSVNIGYAMYAKRTSPLFKDRYISQLLTSLDQVQEMMNAVHKKNDTIFNSFCHYDTSQPINLDWITPFPKEGCRDDRIKADDCSACIRTLAEARQHLERLAKEGGMTVSALIKDKNYRNQLIKDFRRQSILSLKDIGLLFGGLSESSICKILNK